MTHPRFLQGALLAAFAAGPLAAVPIFIGLMFEGPAPRFEALVALPFFLLLATAIGTVVALIPAVGLAALLSYAGTLHPVSRHPLVWATTGLAAGAFIGLWWLDPVTTLGPLPVERPADLGFVALVSGVGAICALIARRGASWGD